MSGGVQTRHLEYLVAVAREKHFARAAAACAVTQPTLSGGLAALEAALGRRLVVRARRFVGLTPEGHAVLPWARRLLADQAELRHAAQSPHAGLRGVLRLGVIPAAMPLVGAYWRALTATHPALEVGVVSMTSREIGRALESVQIDAGLTYLADEAPDHTVGEKLYEETYLLARRRDPAHPRAPEIEWTEALEAPLCLLSPDMQFRRMLDAHVRNLGLHLRPQITANAYVALLSLVRDAGLACILPQAYAALVAANAEFELQTLRPAAAAHAVGLVISDRQPRAPLAHAALLASQALDLHAVDFPS